MSRKTKDEALKTRMAILKAAVERFYAKGVVSSSLQEIAAAAGVTRGAVYWHFKDKAALLRAIADDIFFPHEDLLDRLAGANPANPLRDLRILCLQSLAEIVRDPHKRRVFTILTKRCEYLDEMAELAERNRRCRDKVVKKLTGIFEQAQRKKKLASRWSPRTAALALQNMFFGFVMGEMEWPQPNAAREKTYCEVVDVFFDMLRA